MGINDSYWMLQAYQQALESEKIQEVPVGAVLINSHNECIGRGYNQVIQKMDPTAHAEILAIREASQNLCNYRLDDCTLYVTLEPCSMCAGALVQSRIKRIVFATRDFKAGAAGSVCNLTKGFPFNHAIQVDEGIMQKECALLLKNFFVNKR